MSGNPQIDIVHVLGWMGNLSRTLVIRREIGRFKNRETKPSWGLDRKSTRLNSSHSQISYAVFCLKKKKNQLTAGQITTFSETPYSRVTFHIATSRGAVQRCAVFHDLYPLSCVHIRCVRHGCSRCA